MLYAADMLPLLSLFRRYYATDTYASCHYERTRQRYAVYYYYIIITYASSRHYADYVYCLLRYFSANTPHATHCR